MIITSVRIKRINNSGNSLLGIADVQFDNCLVIHGIKIVQLKDKRVLSFPSRQQKRIEVVDGEYKEGKEFSDIVHPCNKEFRQYVEEEIFKIYDLEVEEESK